MRKSLTIFALGAIMMALGACHTTEANYRAAYDVAKAKAVADREEIDPEVQAQIERAKKRRQQIYIVGTDTVTVTSRFVSREDEPDGEVPEFLVVVNEFEQRFNALAMMRRLRENGIPAAMVVRNSDPTYYVIAESADSVAAVPALIEKAAKETAKLGLADGYPMVLRNPNRKK
ncbi:MAG: hypothetical protein K2G15_01895 [Muribaculaceae bacterium]|nr:hypothetical protein [Muribaculaceae bacterium]